MVVNEQGINLKFLREFKKIIIAETRRGREFFISVGGGATCRIYQAAGKKLGLKNADLDKLGISVLAANLELVRLFLPSHGVHFREVTEMRPGRSTDASAVNLAKEQDAALVINISNIARVCDSDPKKNPQARCFEKLSWSEYLRVIPKKWVPGMHTPFDPVAARLAAAAQLKVVFISGQNLAELKKVISGQKFSGTIIL